MTNYLPEQPSSPGAFALHPEAEKHWLLAADGADVTSGRRQLEVTPV